MSKKPTYEELEEEIQELRKSLSESKRNEVRFKAVFNQQFHFIAIITPEGRVLEVSDNVLRTQGCIREDYVGKFLWESPTWRNFPEWKERIRKHIVKAKSIDGPLLTEDIYQTSDGTTRHVDASYTAMRGEDKEVDYVLVQARDITERKHAEEALKASEARYRTILDTINDGIILQSASGEILTWNKGAEKIFGIPAKEVIGQTSEGRDWPTIHEDGNKYEGIDHPSMRTLQSGKPCKNEIMGVYQPSGDLRWISINTNPLFTENSEKPYAVAISFSDITELRQAMGALQESEKNYRDIFHNSSDTIFIHDAETGAIMDVNKTTCDVLGYSVDELKSLSVGNLSANVPPFTNVEAVQWIHRSLEEGPQRFEWLAKDRNDKLIWFENSLLHAEIAGKDRILVFGRNIDDRKRAEKAALAASQLSDSIVHSSPIGISIYNSDGNCEAANDAAAEMVGATKAQVLQQNYNQIDSWKKSGLYDVVMRSIQEKTKKRHEMDVETTFGKITSLDVHVVPFTIEDGPHLLIMFDDITDRKLAQDEIARFGRIFEDSLNEIYLFKPDTLRLLHANKGARHNLGYTMEELQELTPLDLKPEFTAESFSELLAPLRKGEKEKIVFETVHKRKDQSRMMWKSTCSFLNMFMILYSPRLFWISPSENALKKN